MLKYLIFSIDAGGGISTPTTVVSCPDDVQAVAEAKALNLGLMVEIWQGNRQVAVLTRDHLRRKPLSIGK